MAIWHIAVSSVSHTIELFVTARRNIKTDRYKYIFLLFLYDCIFEKNQPSSETLQCHFHFIFPVMPEK